MYKRKVEEGKSLVEGRFFIGKNEKHEIYVFYSLLTGKLKVDIDGKRVTDSWHVGITKTLNYTLGDKEIHEVMIKISGILIPHIEAYVDGRFLSRI